MNKTIPVLLFGIGAWLLYSGISNKSPIPLLGSLFGFAPKSGTTTPSGPASAQALNAVPGQAASNLAQSVQGGNLPSTVAPGTPTPTQSGGTVQQVNPATGQVNWTQVWESQ